MKASVIAKTGLLKWLTRPVMALLIIVVIMIAAWFILVSYNKGYEQYAPGLYDDTYLFKQVKPAKNYKYWALAEGHFNHKPEILYCYGVKPDSLKIHDPGGDLFRGCLPAICYKYIVYLDGNKLKYVNSDKQLPAFIGKIDNVVEAMLVGKANNFYFDNTHGSGYKLTSGGYELIAKRSSPCPHKIETYKLEFDINGLQHVSKILTEDKGGCLVY